MTSLNNPSGEYQFATPSQEEHTVQCSSYALYLLGRPPKPQKFLKLSKVKDSLWWLENEIDLEEELIAEKDLGKEGETDKDGEPYKVADMYKPPETEKEKEDREKAEKEKEEKEREQREIARQKERARKRALKKAQKESKSLIQQVVDILMAHELAQPAPCNAAKGPKYTHECDCYNQNTDFKVPFHILAKYNIQTLPRSILTTRKLLRPLIFLDMQVVGTKCLERVTVELYTEACPAVVMEFIHCCAKNERERFKFRHSTPLLWLEAELKPKHPIELPCSMEYDMRALDHGSACGILSFPGRYVNGFPRGTVTFSMSYSPLPAMNGTRVAFGIVTSGLRVLHYMQKFALLYDNNTERFIVKKCGLVDR